MCINATTKKWYTENDCSYTLASVPKQDCVQKFVFLFRLNPNKYLGIPIKSSVSFVSSMSLLTHRQQRIVHNPPFVGCNKETGHAEASTVVQTKAANFINICIYVNRRLSNHI